MQNEHHESQTSPFLGIGRIMTMAMVILMGLCIVAYLIISLKIYSNNRNEVLPVHIYQINFFTSTALQLAYGTLSAIVYEFYVNLQPNPEDVHCYYYNYLGVYIFLNNAVSIIIMQVDRFIAINQPFFHHSTISSRVAMTTIGLSYLFSLIPLFLIYYINPGIFYHCYSCLRSELGKFY